MDIKVLDLSDFDINEIDDTIDIGDTQDNIFFSYPYYSHNDIDFQFRLTFVDDKVHIDEVKTDNNMEFDCIELLNNIKILDYEKFQEYLVSFIDFRDDKTMLTDGIINLNTELLDSNEKLNIIRNNKIYVLHELYNIFLE
tara:strand:- start:357 stop:776 length:420 start_codon:yes stop_codon:yes gene_type:complete